MDKGYGRIAWIILLILCLDFFVGFASADGIIIPRPIPDIPHIPPLSIKYHHVNVSIENQYAKTEIDQVFENEFGRDLEGTYIFPLPEDAGISEFSMFADNEKLEGKILEKEKAIDIYEGIVRQLKDPALLEYTGRNAFTARVYPIPANGEKRIQLVYSEVVKCDNGICRYTYPLETEKFSSNPLRDVVVSLKLRSKEAIKAIYSPTHKISIKRIGDYEAEVSYEENNVKPDRDFVLYWTISEEDLGVNLLTYGEKGEDGFFILLLSPRQEIPKEEILPKDIVFVLDTSGSMSGEKIKQAKNALKFIVTNLNEDDGFDIITFNTEIKKFDDGLIDVNPESRKNAVNFIDKIDASGGTNIHDALLDSLKLFDIKPITITKSNCPQIQCIWDPCPGEHLPDAQGCINCASPCPAKTNSTKIIVFLTDGLPTVGVTETNRILDDVKSANKNRVKIFAFGVGYDVNTHLLDKISGQNNGASEYVEPDEDIEAKISGFYGKISSPVLSDVKLEFNGIAYDVYPKEIPDLFKGSQLVVFGRYSNERSQSKKDVAITTDKTEYQIGEKVKLTITNNLEESVGIYNVAVEKYDNEKWNQIRYDTDCPCSVHCEKALQKPLLPKDSAEFLWNQEDWSCQTVREGRYRFEVRWRIGGIDYYVLPSSYSNEFAIKEKSAIDHSVEVKLTGKFLNSEKSYSYALNFPNEDLRNEFIPKLWASRKIGYLLDEIRLNGENREIVDEIINLSLRYGIMTPYTSFLVDMDKDISRPAVRDEARNMFNTIAMKSFSQTTGAGAVKTAESMQEMQKSGISQDGSEKVKSIGAKTFYSREGIWTDNEYTDDAKAIELNYSGDDYFRFIAENPEFGKYLSIGKNVKFCSEGRCFEIRETGIEIPTTTIPAGATTTTLPGITPIDNDQILVQAIAIVGLLILISFGILFLSRRK